MTSYHNIDYQLPPEWAPQSGVLLTWPHSYGPWEPFIDQVDPVFVDMATQISQQTKVIISCFDAAHQHHINTLLKAAKLPLENVQLAIAESDDAWVRDHGPITVLDPQKNPRLLDFVFNNWGNKYPGERDTQITRTLYHQGIFDQTPLQSIDWVLEGGSIEVDDHGTLLTTERCLLSSTRNPHFDRQTLESQLKQLLGIKRILWLKHGYLAGDDTDSHIDTLARFTDAHTICYTACDDPNDEHFTELNAMKKELQQFKDYQGQAYRLVPLPLPQAQFSQDGNRLPATYANFLITNRAVLMPIYNDAADNKAQQQLQSCFPDRKVIPIYCRPLIELYGSLHCVTMQVPAGVFKS